MKCQDSWATSFPWPEMLQKKDREIHNVKCVMCYKVTRKDLIFVAKSNAF